MNFSNFFNQLANNIANWENVYQTFISLCYNYPWITLIIVLILIIVVIYTLFKQSREFFSFVRYGWNSEQANTKSRLLIIIISLLSVIISYSIVFGIRTYSLPSPIFIDPDGNPIESPIFNIRRPLFLQWQFNVQEYLKNHLINKEENLKYKIQRALDPDFTEPICIYKNYNTTSYPHHQFGKIVYWRIRAVQAEVSNKKAENNDCKKYNRSISPWSQIIQSSSYLTNIDRIQQRGEIRVGRYISDSQTFLKFGNDFEGLESDLIKLIKESLSEDIGKDVKIKWLEVNDWTKLLELPQKGSVDLIISTITRNDEREEQKKLKSSKVYYATNKALVSLKEQNLCGDGDDSCDQPIIEIIKGRKIGVNQGTTSQVIINELNKLISNPSERIIIEPFEIESYENNLALYDKEVDYIFTDFPYAKDMEERNCGNLKVKEIKTEDYPSELDNKLKKESYVIAVRSDESNLLNKINEVIEDLKKTKKDIDGTVKTELNKLIDKNVNKYKDYRDQPNC